MTQQARPDVFQPKVVELYNALFKVRPSPLLLRARRYAGTG